MDGHLLMARKRCVQIGGGKHGTEYSFKKLLRWLFWTIFDNKNN